MSGAMNNALYVSNGIHNNDMVTSSSSSLLTAAVAVAGAYPWILDVYNT